MSVRVDFNTGTPEQPVWSDITSFVRSVSFDRGKNESIGSYSAGNCSIVLDNRGRQFDPTYTSSPYNAAIVPRRQVRVFSDYGTAPGGVRTNLARNPSGETNTTFWATDGSSGVLADSPGLYGTKSFSYLAALGGGTATYLETTLATLATNTTYTASFYYKDNLRFSGTVTLTVRYDSTSVDLATFTVSALQPWARVSATFLTPPSVGTAQRLRWTFASATESPMIIDGVLVEAAAFAGTYFDGSFTDTALSDYAWTGTAHNSTSTDTFLAESGHQFVGYITDWDLDYQTSGDATATIRASDGFTLLSNQTVPDQVMPIERSGVRIQRLLNTGNIQWPADRRNIDTGRETLADDTTQSANALSYLQQIEATEGGRLFVAKNGDLRFDSGEATNLTLPVVAAFADTGAGIRYEDVRVVYGTEQLANQITADYNGGSVSADNLTSQANYGVTRASLPELLVNNPDDAQYLVSSYVNQFGEPAYRVDELVVNLRALSNADQTTVLGLELGDHVSVQITPAIGSAITQNAEIVRIARSITDAETRDLITFGLDTYRVLPFILDSAEYGRLDQDALGF